jgi:aminopeptidase N
MSGFMRYDQGQLIALYVDEYFAALPGLWAARDIEVAMAFASAMYPSPAMSEELVRQTARFLEAEAPPPSVRRYLIEGADEVARALRARALDRAMVEA